MLHPRTARTAAAFAVLAGGAVVALTAQTAPTVDLAKRNARSRYTVGTIGGLQELPDGRVVIGDRKDNAFRLINLDKGDDTPIGSQGTDPDDYRTAFGVFRGAADSVLLLDAGGRKLIHLSAQGAIGEMVPLPTRTVTLGARTMQSVLMPTASDATGAIYYLVSVPRDTANKTANVESAIHRMPAGATTDAEIARITTRRADQTPPAVSGLVPFVFRDAWAVRGDGLVARVTSDTFQVIWLRDGKETGRTGPIAYQPIAITAAEQQAIRDSLLDMSKAMAPGNGGPPPGMDGGRGAGMAGGAAGAGPIPAAAMGAGGQQVFVLGGAGGQPIVMGGGGGQTVTIKSGDGTPGGQTVTNVSPAAMQEAMAKMADVPAANFPANKPALPSANNIVIASFDANGMLWVARERAHGDQVPHYDVIAEGKGVVGHVNLPPKSRLVGFGKGVVYLARIDNDQEWLERYPMPKF